VTSCPQAWLDRTVFGMVAKRRQGKIGLGAARLVP
jgi:hypothetical protein